MYVHYIDYVLQAVIAISLLAIAWSQRFRIFPTPKSVGRQPGRERVVDALAHSIREDCPIYFFICQLDRFKNVTAIIGVEGRSIIIQEIDRRFREVLPTDAEVGLLRGEEFGVVLHDKYQVDSVVLGQRLLDVFVRPFSGVNFSIFLTASIGYCHYPDDAQTINGMLVNADTALGHAKNRGGGFLSRYSYDMTVQLQKRLDIMTDIRRGLNESEFVPWYQPRVDTRTEQVRSVECLARWCKPSGKIVPPYDFIELAEESGLIVSLGTHILEKSCRAGCRWIEEFGDKAPSISVNVSQKQLHRGFPEVVARVLANTGFPANKLELELTESGMMTAVAEIKEILLDLRRMGVRVSVDDFGTGYSSLSYLQEFKVNALKIDSSFVKRLGQDSTRHQAGNIICSIVNLAQGLELETVAEGVEDKEQKDFIVSSGCDEIQGYFYAKPMPEERFREWFLASLGKHTIFPPETTAG